MPKDVTLRQQPQFVTLTKIPLEFKIQQLKKLHNVQNAPSQVNGNKCDMVHNRLYLFILNQKVLVHVQLFARVYFINS